MSSKTWATALCVTVLTSMAAPARACLAPEPITCAATGVGIIVGIFKAITTKNVVHPISAEQNLEVVTQIVRDLREIKHYTIRMGKYAQYNPGYGSIQRRFESNKIKGNLSLEDLMDFSPSLFTDLDTLEAVIAQNVGEETVSAVYGQKYMEDGSINWQRYYLLAKDADQVYKSLFAVKR